MLPVARTGDTGFLNAFFPDWYRWPHEQRLPFQYNALRTMYWRLAGKSSRSRCFLAPVDPYDEWLESATGTCLFGV